MFIYSPLFFSLCNELASQEFRIKSYPDSYTIQGFKSYSEKSRGEVPMKPGIQISTFGGGLELYKIPRTWGGDLSVYVAMPGRRSQRRKIEFPADKDHITITGLDREVLHQVNVIPCNLLKRIRRGSQKFEVRPECTPFRVIISGSGRCGTTTLAQYLNGMQFNNGMTAKAQHETLQEYILPWIVQGNSKAIKRLISGQSHNIESAPYLALVPEVISADVVVHLVRDGRRVCQSGMIRQWYGDDTPWNRIKPDFPGSRFEKICHLWRHMNEQMESVNGILVRLEDLAESPRIRADLLKKLGLRNDGRPFPHSNKGTVPSLFDSWTPEMRSTFANICGPLMDRYYPGWQETW